MKIKQVNGDFGAPYGENLLKERGINDPQKILNPKPDQLIDSLKLDNVAEGIALLHNVAIHNEPILVIADCDVDGYTSAAMLILYLKKVYNLDVDYVIHEGKQHGLEDMMDYIKSNPHYKLVVCPDASSNDYVYHEELKKLDIPVLVIDHHEADPPFSDNAVIINNQLSNNYENKGLTGAGVMFQFLLAMDRNLNKKEAYNYIDLAALGIVGDMGLMSSPENCYIVREGLDNINNFFFRSLVDKQDYSMGGLVNPITVAFYIVPLINAMIRVGTQEEKIRLLEAFIDGSRKVPSNKRGAKGTEEFLAIESARECVNARAKQNRIKDKAVEELEYKIHKYGLLDNKILFVRLEDDDDFPSVLNGLVAMQLAARFKKPTIVARLNNEGMVRGSARGLNESELKDFKEYLNSTGMFEYTAGHANAFGVSVKDDLLRDLHSKANFDLEIYNFNEGCFEVNFTRNANDSDINDIVIDLNRYRNIWGQGNPEPLIAIKNIRISKKDIKTMGKNNDTVKFDCCGVTYLKFKANNLIEELMDYDDILINIVGRTNLNEWGGMEIPQIFIESYEILDGELEF